MRLLDDPASPPMDGEPLAPAVGPFPRRPFVATWARHRASGEILVAEHDGLALPLHFHEGHAEIAGEEDLTDYHSPLGDGDPDEFGMALAGALPPGTSFRFDSLPAEAADPLERGLVAAGLAVGRARHEAAAVLDLPGDYDSHLARLRGKDRHETRRKARRFEEMLGPASLVHGREGFDAFAAMHRASEGRKGSFLDEDMEAFFTDLLEVPGAVVSLLMGGDDPVAAAFGFEDDGAYYLYNSAYDPGAGAASPGVILVDRLIAAAIGAGRHTCDFLKGDEAYKYRMGAAARPLFALEGIA